MTFTTLTSIQLLQEDFRKAASPITASEAKRKMFYGQNKFLPFKHFLNRAQHLRGHRFHHLDEVNHCTSQ